ncbi:MAG: hypothetical protein OXH79_06530 [Boseongicola sp.]|nr:hypothetical protein [Boseongicola sp.]
MSRWASLASFRGATRQKLALGMNAWVGGRWTSVIPSISAQAVGLGAAVSQ